MLYRLATACVWRVQSTEIIILKWFAYSGSREALFVALDLGATPNSSGKWGSQNADFWGENIGIGRGYNVLNNVLNIDKIY